MAMASSSSADRKATEQDLLAVLVALDPLPRRSNTLVDVHLEAFRVALEDDVPGRIEVERRDLVVASRRCLQARHGHAFHPSPAELRMMINAVRDERLSIVEQERHRAAIREEAAAFGPVKHDPAEAERVARIYREFCAWDDRERRGVVPADEEMAAIKAKYSAIALAQIPDRPVSDAGNGR